MLAIGIAILIVGDRSIYSEQIRSRADSPAHRFRVALPLLASIPAGTAARIPRLRLGIDDQIGDAQARLAAAGLPGAPVVDDRGRFRGSIEASDLAAAEPGSRLATLHLDDLTVGADDALVDALGVLTDHHRSWLPVVTGEHLIGILSAGDILGTYRSALASNMRQVRAVGADGVLIETELSDGSIVAGQTVASTAWPRDSILVSIERDDQLIVPRGDLTLLVGDRLTVFATATGRPLLEALFSARPEADPLDDGASP
jgi:CIC family chloride channel protein